MMMTTNGSTGLAITAILLLVIALATFIYVIVSLIDMWKAYSREKDQNALLFFIISLAGLIFTGGLISLILAIIFYWRRRRGKRLIGILLILASIVLTILLVYFMLQLGFDMSNWEDIYNDPHMPMNQDGYDI
ncbi:hypothetical protein [Exiguobacterium flavidum]|uniref:hypothetical protein n=1 Tax=Exiguobacterium flavidum TaxID=2184695 RepID=UPI000DF85993|nr:hypothetical protein [Exiguobacterium flavidum]